ncbi:hypothetical protein ACKWTF_002458 [Chironomus riparius]
MKRRKRKQDLSPKMDFDEIPSGSKQNLKKQRKQVPEKKNSTAEPEVPVTAAKAEKPLFIQQNINGVRKIISQINLQVKPAFKISSAATTQVIVKNVEDKASIISVLRFQCIPFHTFSEKSEKTKSFVLKGFYETPTNEVLRLLQEAKVSAVKVTILVKKSEFTFYLVHFQDESVNINVLNHNHLPNIGR